MLQYYSYDEPVGHTVKEKVERNDMEATPPSDKLANLDGRGLTRFAEMLENNPDDADALLVDGVAGDMAFESSAQDCEDEESENFPEGYLDRVEEILSLPLPPVAASLGELRAQANMTIDEVGDYLGLSPETIDYLEEDSPVLGTPRPLLRALGDLFGYSAAQVDAVLNAQGTQGSISVAYKLKPGAAPPSAASGAPAPRSFEDVMAETGATPAQRQRWLAADDTSDDEYYGIGAQEEPLA